MPQTTATFDSVFFKSATGAAAPGDEIPFVRDFSADDSRAVIDVTSLGDGFHFNMVGARTISLTMSGALDAASAVHTAIRTAYEAGTLGYLHVIVNPAATVGLLKGYTYPVYVSKLALAYGLDATVDFDTEMSLAAAPTTILGT